MREIKCVFSTSRLVETMFVRTETTRYYRDEPGVNFDIVIDFLKLFWSHRHTIACIDPKLYINGSRVSLKSELFMKGMIDSTLDVADGEIPLTELQISILIDKVRQMKKFASPKSDNTEE